VLAGKAGFAIIAPMIRMRSIPDPEIDRGPLHLPPTLAWAGGVDGALHLLDQTRLPHAAETRICRSAEDVWEAIRALQVRGAPAIGIAAAYGLCLGTRAATDGTRAAFSAAVTRVGDYLIACRPTAVNLAWAIRAVQQVVGASDAADAAGDWANMLARAHELARADAETCRRIGEAGADLVPEGGGVLTHCNAGALATVAWGTALALLYVAKARGRRFRVYADETRPLLQGARLTAYELSAAGIDVTVLCEGATASLLRSGGVQLVVVGADRIAANGDTANKIGTYGVALAARRHNVPFYVAAPSSTFDLACPSGEHIPIEERSADEVASIGGQRVAAPGVRCFNPAFDVTPAELIAGIVTERGIVQPVSRAAIAGRIGAK
jgi:methylthioribose-1-phosphate isomerase